MKKLIKYKKKLINILFVYLLIFLIKKILKN